MKTVAIIQARSASTRLPNKVMMKINGAPMISLLLERVKNSNQIDEIIVASTESKEDDQLINFVSGEGYNTYRGSESDVLDRYYQAALKFNAENVVRLTADCPLLDFRLIDEIVREFKSSKVDYLSNTIEPTFPDGLDIEVFSMYALKKAWKNAETAFDKEHVTPFIKKDKSLSLKNYSNVDDLSNMRWTVDEHDDMKLIKAIYKYFNPDIFFKWQDILLLSKNYPEIFLTNSHIKRNEGANMSQGAKLYKRAKQIIPGGNMLLSKRPEMFLPDFWPSYFSHASGCNVSDLEGNNYIDMSIMGIGTNILGYGHKYVDEAVLKTVNNGNMSTLNCPEEVYLAEKLIEINPWADMAKFARTGGEANAIAIRIARAASGKDNVAICGYHGWHDWYLSVNLSDKSDGLQEHLLPGLEIKGVPKSLKDNVFPFSYNNFSQLEKLVETKDIGVIKMEVMRNDEPEDSFLQKVRHLADQRGIVLIFDECTSGFRETYGGLHKKYNVEPDMAMYGKTLGNGYAITAVIGKESIMMEAQSSFISSTFWTERIGPSAALATLKVMKDEESWIKATDIGKRVKKHWSEMASLNNLTIIHNGLDALASFSIESKLDNSNLYKTLIAQEMLKKGYLASNSFYASTAHTYDIVDRYADDLKDIFELISKCEDGMDTSNLLNGPEAHKGFKRLN